MNNMDIIEPIRAWIKRIEEEFEKGCNYYLDNSEQAVGYQNALMDFENFINKLPKIPVSKELEEEYDKYIITDRHLYERLYGRGGLDIARHFAEWGMNQCPLPEDTTIFNKGVAEGKRLMMEEAVEGVVCYGSKGAYIETDFLGEYDTDVYGNSGDKVRVIVIKEGKK